MGVILGDIPATCGHPAHYWQDRDCFVDCRGPLVIDPAAHFGYQVMLLTLSHAVSGGGFVAYSPCIPRGVRVDAGAFVGSRATLYNCQIGTGAIVAVGAVVRSQVVPPLVIVAGNPARIVARWDAARVQWDWVAPRYEVLA